MMITRPHKTTRSQFGHCTDREDLNATQEETDVIIIQQLLTSIKEGAKGIKVVCDDTDVFILLMHFYHLYNWTCNVLMEGTSGDRKVISISESVSKYSDIVSSVLAMHGLSGCDTIPRMSVIGKKTALNILQKGNRLCLLGDIDAPLNEIINESWKFIAACYGIDKYTTMTMARYHLRNKKLTNQTAPQLKSLPPSTEVLINNI